MASVSERGHQARDEADRYDDEDRGLPGVALLLGRELCEKGAAAHGSTVAHANAGSVGMRLRDRTGEGPGFSANDEVLRIANSRYDGTWFRDQERW